MEASILLALQSVRIDGLTQLFALFSALGECSFIWIVIALILMLFENRRETGFILIATLILASIIGAIVANAIGRVNPTQAVTGLVGVMGVGRSGFSMPSLYAVTSFASCATIWRGMGKGAGVGALLLALVISLSRLYLGVSYPSDIIVGAFLGVILALLVSLLLTKIIGLIDFQPKQPKRKQVRDVRGRHSL